MSLSSSPFRDGKTEAVPISIVIIRRLVTGPLHALRRPVLYEPPWSGSRSSRRWGLHWSVVPCDSRRAPPLDGRGNHELEHAAHDVS